MRLNGIRRVRTVATLAAAALLLSAFPAFADDTASSTPDVNFDAAAFESDDVLAGTIVVTTAEGNDTAWASAVSDSSFHQVSGRVFAVKADEGTEASVAAEIAAQPGVVAVEPSGAGEAHTVPSDEYYDLQWAHQQANAEAVWDITTGSGDTTIVIGDSGMDSGHEDISRVSTQLKATDGEIHDGDEGHNDRNDLGHGHHVGGIAAAASDNDTGVAGVDWAAEIVDIDLFDIPGDPEPLTSFVSVAASIGWSGENDADVINLSLGGPGQCPDFMQASIDEATAAGTTVVVSAGNSGDSSQQTPADCDGVVTVAATGPTAERASYSTHNEWVDIAAPGGDLEVDYPAGGIASTRLGTDDYPEDLWVEGDPEYVYLQGTSMAAPYITGVVGLMKSVNDDASPDEVYSCLTETAEHPEGEDRDDDFGHGIVDIPAALACIEDEDDDPEPSDPRRIYTGADETDPAAQAVAASQAAFDDGEATHAVIARDDDYSDALAGSTLTLGTAPVLYTGSEGGLPEVTADELGRVLAEGADVYVLGGPSAIPDEAIDELEDLGYAAERVAGPTRGETAEEVGYKVAELLDGAEGVALAKAFDWPDAVTAGSIGTQLDYPVLVTGYGEDQVDELHESAARALEVLDPDHLITVGGTSAIGEEAEREAADIGDIPEENIVRLGGGSRLESAIAVGDFLVDHLDEDPVIYGVNVRRNDGYAHVLSTSANLVTGGGGVYVPFEGDNGQRYTDDDTAHVREWVEELPAADAFAVGGTDVIVDESVDAFFSDLGLE